MPNPLAWKFRGGHKGEDWDHHGVAMTWKSGVNGQKVYMSWELWGGLFINVSIVLA
jgi:hypothetical protein